MKTFRQEVNEILVELEDLVAIDIQRRLQNLERGESPKKIHARAVDSIESIHNKFMKVERKTDE